MIKLSSITKIYPNGVKALDDVNLIFENKGFVFIVGESGNGKSTLLNIIGTLDSSTSGKLFIDDLNINELDERTIANIRNNYFGFVFQEFYFDKNLNVKDNILLPLEKSISNDANLLELAEDLGVSDLLDRKINELSGGQKQRIQILRSLMKNPKVILADEPTGNLDDNTKDEIYKLFQKLSNDHLVIIVSHDLAAANVYANRIIKIKNGSIIEDLIQPRINYIINDIISHNKISFNIRISKEDKMLLNISKKEEMPKFNKLDLVENSQDMDINIKFANKYRKKLIRNNIISYISNIIITSFLLFFVLSAFFFIGLNSNENIERYINNDLYNNYVLYNDVSYVDDFYDTHAKTLYQGEMLYNDLINNDLEVKPIIKSKILLNEKKIDVSIMYDNNIDLNNIEVSDYFAEINNVKINDIINLNNNDYIVSNIFETDYLKYINILHSTDTRLRSEKEFLLDYQINYIKINYDNLKTNDLSVNFADFTVINSFNKSKNNYINIKPASLYNYSLNNNEIIISKKFAQNHNLNENNIGEVFNFYDIKQDKFNNYFDNIVSLKKYYQNGFIIKDIKEINEVDYLINDDIYNSLVFDYDYYQRPNYYLIKSSKNLINTNYKIFEPNISTFYLRNENYKNSYWIYLTMLIIVSILILIFIISSINQHLSKNLQNIGLFKSLGFENSDIKKIHLLYFLIQNILIVFITVCLFTVVYMLFETKLKNYMLYNAIISNAFPFNSLWFIVIYLVIHSLIIFLNFKNINKKEPIVLIR